MFLLRFKNTRLFIHATIVLKITIINRYCPPNLSFTITYKLCQMLKAMKHKPQCCQNQRQKSDANFVHVFHADIL